MTLNTTEVKGETVTFIINNGSLHLISMKKPIVVGLKVCRHRRGVGGVVYIYE